MQFHIRMCSIGSVHRSMPFRAGTLRKEGVRKESGVSENMSTLIHEGRKR